MPFIPHTPEETQQMLEAIGLNKTDDLFSEIPQNLRFDKALDLPNALSEAACLAQAEARFSRPKKHCFLGAGAYMHHIPSAIPDMMSRGEWLTAYTPYQGEASQGTLQMLFEYQSVMAGLMDMPAFNASLYDGASSLLEAVLMACRVQKKHSRPCLVVPKSLHPSYRRVLETGLSFTNIEWVELPWDASGRIDPESLKALKGKQITAFIINCPTFFGGIEAVDALTQFAHAQGALVIAAVNPLAMAWLKPPGQWGEKGADIVCGEAQPLGVSLSYGGPYLGFMGCQKAIIRQLPGRIVGKTVDRSGREGYVLTLQAREQHIRRSKATSNICTNQGVYALAVVMYASLLGPSGLQRVAETSHRNAVALVDQLCQIDGVSRLFDGPYFHECALTLTQPAQRVLHVMLERDIIGGLALEGSFPELDNSLLVCATEVHSASDLTRYAQIMRWAMRQGGNV